MRTIQISDDVWQFLHKRAHGFGDTPNDALRRALGLENSGANAEGEKHNDDNVQTLNVNRRARGDESRRNYIASLERETSLQLKHAGGSVYVLPSGKQVAISTAIEKRPGMGRWFLGSPAAFYEGQKANMLVLLCAKNDNQLDFIFSPNEMSKLAQILPKIAGQLKFNVVTRSEGRYDLLVSHKPPIDISGRLHDRAQLR